MGGTTTSGASDDLFNFRNSGHVGVNCFCVCDGDVMSKLIIHIDDESMTKEFRKTSLHAIAADLVKDVIMNGMVSETGNGEQYCSLTQFFGSVLVSCRKNKRDTFTFHVRAR